MRDETRLDLAHAAMLRAPEDAAARMHYHQCLADTELCLLLETEATTGAAGDSIAPKLFDFDGTSFVLGFDTEDRMAAFVDRASPYAALPGRVIAGLLAGQGIGLGINLGDNGASYLMPAEAVDWLAATLGHAPSEIVARPREVFAPRGLPEVLLAGLAARLAVMPGVAASAHLVGVRYADGRQGHLLVIADAFRSAEAALAKAASEGLTFSGVDAGELDVVFLPANAPLAVAARRLGLAFDLGPTDPGAG